MLADDADGTNWAAFGRTYGEQHFSPLDQVNASNVAKLGLVWSIDLLPGNSVTGPLAIDGILYFARAYSVVMAVNATTGQPIWTFDPHAPEASAQKLRQGWGSRGIAYWEGKIFTGTQDGRLIAIDAATGREVWSAMTVGKEDMRFISGPPRAFDGKIIIGHGGADGGPTRGYVTAYDAATGRQLWRFHTVPGDPAKGFESDAMRMAASTWAGKWWKHGGGGTVWNAITYDRDLDAIYIGTGNGAPSNRRVRSMDRGDNLFLSSIVALDAKSGAYRWHYQTNPGETWDYNAAMDMQLTTLPIDGRDRKVLLTAPKNGFFYVIDRANGKLISAKPYAKVSWAKGIDIASGRPIETPGARYPNGSSFVMWPGGNGSHTWLPMAYSPRTRLVYIPAIELSAKFDDIGVDPKTWRHRPGNAAGGSMHMSFAGLDPPNGTSSLVAWNPITQSVAWRVPHKGVWNGGVMATGGGLVFQGRTEGFFDAYDATSGQRLWSFAAGAAVVAPPITYTAGGRQYVTVLSGMGTSGGVYGPLIGASIDYRTQARRVLTFAIGGTATLAPTPTFKFVAASDPGFSLDGAAAKRGGAIFESRCMQCHGGGAIAGGVAPDLRASSIPADEAVFRQIVKDGVLVPSGMPRFEDIAESDLADVRHYIRAQGAMAREGQRH